MRAERVGRDTLLAQIVRMVAEAQRSRAPIQRLADSVSGVFVPAVVGAAIVAFAAWALVGPAPRLPHALVAGDLRPDHRLPLRAGAGDADVDHGRDRAGGGGGRAVQERRGAGGLAPGRHDRDRQDRYADRGEAGAAWRSSRRAGEDERSLLRLAASLERASEHPLAAAIVRGAAGRGVAPGEATGVEALAGRGVRGRVDGRAVALGNARLLDELGIDAGRRRGARRRAARRRPDGRLRRRRRPRWRGSWGWRSDQAGAPPR